MALASSESSTNLNGNHDEIVELEITEVDEALLRNLLDESMNEETREDGVMYAAYSLDVNDDSNAKISEQELEQCGLQFSDLDWDDMVDVAGPALPMDENMMVWYINDMVGMVDFACNGDYSEVYNEVFSDETPYCCLWQE